MPNNYSENNIYSLGSDFDASFEFDNAPSLPADKASAISLLKTLKSERDRVRRKMRINLLWKAACLVAALSSIFISVNLFSKRQQALNSSNTTPTKSDFSNVTSASGVFPIRNYRINRRRFCDKVNSDISLLLSRKTCGILPLYLFYTSIAASYILEKDDFNRYLLNTSSFIQRCSELKCDDTMSEGAFDNLKVFAKIFQNAIDKIAAS